MRRKVISLVIAAFLCCTCAQAAGDLDTILTGLGTDQMTQALPPEARRSLDGIDLAGINTDWNGALARLIQNVNQKQFLSSAVRSLTKMLLVAVIVGALSGLRSAAGGGELPIVNMAGALGMTGVLLSDLRGMLSLCIQTLDYTAVFSTAMLPVMAGALTVQVHPLRRL